MEQIQINHTNIFGDVDRMFSYLLEMYVPAKMRLVTATQSKIRLATDVVEVAITSVDCRTGVDRNNAQVAGVTLYYPPRAPEGSNLQMRFYLNAANEMKCIEYSVPPRGHQIMAILVAWWFLNTTYAPVIYTDVADLFHQDNWPGPPTPDDANRIRQVVQLLKAYMASERLKEKESA